jgi:predicted nucleic acid-binding protein
VNLVVDASVFVAEQLENQPEFDVAARFLDFCVKTKVHMYAPVIVIGEVSGAVARMTGDPKFGTLAANRLRRFQRLVYRQIDLDFAEAAGRLAARYQLRGADAHYLALARELRCPLITNDGEMLHVASLTVRVLTPVAGHAQLRKP